MRIVALLGDRAVIERRIRHLGLWPACRDARGAGRAQGVCVRPSTGPPVAAPEERVVEPCLGVEDPPGRNPFRGYDTELIMMYANG